MAKHVEFQLDNGLQVVVEPVVGVASAAYCLLMPGGVSRDPEQQLGLANLLSQMVTRGAGDRDARDLMLAIDSLGLQHRERVDPYFSLFSGALVGQQLADALPLLADIVRRPTLDAEHLEYCRAGLMQELMALEDEPSQKLLIALKQAALPHPLGQPTLGTPLTVPNLSRDHLHQFLETYYRPNLAILGIAGAVDVDEVKRSLEGVFGDWAAGPEVPLELSDPIAGSHHILDEKKTQTHIGLCFDAVAFDDDDYFNAHGVAGVLSGGMSSRLFTEVREKRGLCYTIGASFVPMKDRGLMLCYSGTTNERAGQTLQVLTEQLQQLPGTITQDELDRMKVGLKSGLVMHEESTGARAAALVRGKYFLGRVRTLEEVSDAIDKLTVADLEGYLERHPADNFTVVTLGPQPLEVASS